MYCLWRRRLQGRAAAAGDSAVEGAAGRQCSLQRGISQDPWFRRPLARPRDQGTPNTHQTTDQQDSHMLRGIFTSRDIIWKRWAVCTHVPVGHVDASLMWLVLRRIHTLAWQSAGSHTVTQPAPHLVCLNCSRVCCADVIQVIHRVRFDPSHQRTLT